MSTSSHQVSSKSIQRFLEKKSKMWKVYGRTDGRTTTTTDGRTTERCAMTIAHLSLRLRWAKNRLISIIRNAFILKNGNRRYKYLLLGHDKHILWRSTPIVKISTLKNIIKMLEFLVDNILWFLPEKSSSRQSAVKWVRTVPIFSPTSFCIIRIIPSLLSTGKRQLASRFHLTYRYIDDVLSINNPEFEIWKETSTQMYTPF